MTHAHVRQSPGTRATDGAAYVLSEHISTATAQPGIAHRGSYQRPPPD